MGETIHEPPVQRCLEVASRQLRPFSKKPCSECSGEVCACVEGCVAGVAATATGSCVGSCSVLSVSGSVGGTLDLSTGNSTFSISSISSSSSVSSKSNELIRDFISFSVHMTEPQCRRKCATHRRRSGSGAVASRASFSLERCVSL